MPVSYGCAPSKSATRCVPSAAVAIIFVGNGDTAGLHHQAYDFNDEAIPVGTSYRVRLVETALAD